MAFVRAARKDEIPAGSIREFQVDGLTLAIANVGDKFFAVHNTCLHRGGPLGQGELHGVAGKIPGAGPGKDGTTPRMIEEKKVGGEESSTKERGEDTFGEGRVSPPPQTPHFFCPKT